MNTNKKTATLKNTNEQLDIKAAVLNGANQKLEVSDLKLDPPKASEVLVKIVSSGVCHTDATVIDRTIPIPLPAALGHEGAGIVEKVGSQVENFKKGDHVIIGYAYCGQCKYCKAGMPGSCVRLGELNMGTGRMKDHTTRIHTKDGKDVSNFFGQSSLSTYAVADQNNLVKVANSVDLRYVGPLGCGFMTGSGTVLSTRALNPEAGSNIAVFGTGAVGLAAIMAGKIASCDHVIAVDIVDSRLKLALKLGATDIINSKNTDPVKKIKQITNGWGVDNAVDTTGVPPVTKSGIDSLSINGKIAPLAVSNKTVTFNPLMDLTVPTRKFIGSAEGNVVPQEFIPRLVELRRKGEFPIDKLTKFYSLDQVNQAFEDSKNGKTVKPVIIMDKDYQPG